MELQRAVIKPSSIVVAIRQESRRDAWMMRQSNAAGNDFPALVRFAR